MIHHVQIVCPPGSEDLMRQFYGGVLGWAELPRPPQLATGGGCWFRVPGVGGPDGELHVGVEEPFVPARKAHPAFVVDVDAVAAAVEAADHPVSWATDISGRRRFHTNDPVGNRLEFLDRAAGI
ncbi:MAG TPA: glyoxalase [Actinophytocola sp.]|uniref:glyoxalase n=1 Tax=Actinophytocola sp. TaxID=1872138 RepID=UPI002DDCEDCE|nr:glyoxalase [Actinophytocola sp.]HEV2779341.1 glyoxalase [Actinophytocola sp.]